MGSYPYVLVAERSVLGTINLVVESLEAYGHPASINVVVPRAEVALFGDTRCREHAIVAEDDVLPDWPLSRIRSALRGQAHRAGWYLQQFLKLSFVPPAGVRKYVIWDADTVMLSRPVLQRDSTVVMSTSREYHRPYFDTFERLFGRRPVLSHSAIAQYMLMDTTFLQEMKVELEQRFGTNWIQAILSVLPGRCPSEFSEYESYANYIEMRHPGTVSMQTDRWFRYGSDVMSTTSETTLADVERKFRGYAYVVFERHGRRPARTLGAALLRLLKY